MKSYFILNMNIHVPSPRLFIPWYQIGGCSECLLSVCEDLSSDLQLLQDSQIWQCTSVTPKLEGLGWETKAVRFLELSWPFSKYTNSRNNERPGLKTEMESRKIHKTNPWPPYACIPNYRYTCTCVHPRPPRTHTQQAKPTSPSILTWTQWLL